MQHQIITDIVTEPVSLAEAKAQIVADYDNDDTMLASKIKTARMWLEQYTGLAFGEKTVKVYYDALDEDFELPIGPVIGNLTTVTRTVSGETTTLTTSDYWLTGLLYQTIDFTKVWTSGGCVQPTYAVTYQAGFTTSNPLPEPLKDAICKLVAELYRDRENTISGTINTMLPHHVRALASPYRRRTWL